MNIQRSSVFAFLACIVLLLPRLPAEVQPQAAQSQPVALLNQPTSRAIAVPAPQSDGIWRNYTSGNRVHTLAMEGDHVWAGTSGGVVRWNRIDGSYVRYTAIDGLADNHVYAIAIDGAGHKWFGTSDGLSEFDGANWTTYTTADGLPDDDVLAIAIDGVGHKWFGTHDGVSEFDGSTWTTYTTEDGLADDYVNAIAIDGAGHKWFGTSDFVSEFDGSTWTTYTTEDGLADDYVSAIAIDGAGHKWVYLARQAGRRISLTGPASILWVGRLVCVPGPMKSPTRPSGHMISSCRWCCVTPEQRFTLVVSQICQASFRCLASALSDGGSL